MVQVDLGGIIFDTDNISDVFPGNSGGTQIKTRVPPSTTLVQIELAEVRHRITQAVPVPGLPPFNP
jgi:hypothetical protein